MTISESELAARLQKLRDAYAARLAERIQEIVAHAQPLLDGTWDPDAAERTGRAAHSLAGTGKTFGFPVVGAAARVVEHLIEELREADATAQSTATPRIEESVEALLAAARSEGVATSEGAEAATTTDTTTDATRPPEG